VPKTITDTVAGAVNFGRYQILTSDTQVRASDNHEESDNTQEERL
jgi:hypothetical protein